MGLFHERKVVTGSWNHAEGTVFSSGVDKVLILPYTG